MASAAARPTCTRVFLPALLLHLRRPFAPPHPLSLLSHRHQPFVRHIHAVCNHTMSSSVSPGTRTPLFVQSQPLLRHFLAPSWPEAFLRSRCSEHRPLCTSSRRDQSVSHARAQHSPSPAHEPSSSTSRSASLSSSSSSGQSQSQPEGQSQSSLLSAITNIPTTTASSLNSNPTATATATAAAAAAAAETFQYSSPTRPRSETRCRRTVKRKVALVVAYDGSSYHGFQRNAGVHTVSDVLEHGLHAADLISDDNFGDLAKIKWQVAARTDRGVSAAGNLLSAKLLFDRAELESGSALLRSKARINRCLPPHVRVLSISQITGSFNARACCEARWYEYLLPMAMLNDDVDLPRFDALLNQYTGSNLFHNFTVGQDHSVPPRVQARRYITMCTCDHTPLIINGDFPVVRIRVRGQSFVLHQIRKMVSLAILVANKQTPEDAIKRSLDPTVLINVPPAPATGLFLDCCRFGWYNERQKSFLVQPLSMCDVDYLREAFKHKHIVPSIAQRFQERTDMQDYLNTVESHPVRFHE